MYNKPRGSYFWTVVEEQLKAKKSLTEIAASVGSTFNELWDHFRKTRKNTDKNLHIYLGREAKSDSVKRLNHYWPKIVAAYTKDKKIRPDNLALRWGIPGMLVAVKLKKDKLLRESQCGVDLILGGCSLDDVLDELLVVDSEIN